MIAGKDPLVTAIVVPSMLTATSLPNFWVELVEPVVSLSYVAMHLPLMHVPVWPLMLLHAVASAFPAQKSAARQATGQRLWQREAGSKSQQWNATHLHRRRSRWPRRL